MLTDFEHVETDLVTRNASIHQGALQKIAQKDGEVIAENVRTLEYIVRLRILVMDYKGTTGCSGPTPATDRSAQPLAIRTIC